MIKNLLSSSYSNIVAKHISDSNWLNNKKVNFVQTSVIF